MQQSMEEVHIIKKEFIRPIMCTVEIDSQVPIAESNVDSDLVGDWFGDEIVW